MGVWSVSMYLIRRPATHETCSAICVSVSRSGPKGEYPLPLWPSSVSVIAAERCGQALWRREVANHRNCERTHGVGFVAVRTKARGLMPPAASCLMRLKPIVPVAPTTRMDSVTGREPFLTI
jgi:hypothetical protein